MPLYQMLCITAHFDKYEYIRELVRQTATLTMNRGGVVRNIKFSGTRTLPQRMKQVQSQDVKESKRSKGRNENENENGRGVYAKVGDYWTMHFDASPRTVWALKSLMRQDPRVLRWTVLKLGDKVEDIAKVGEKIQCGTNETLPDLID